MKVSKVIWVARISLQALNKLLNLGFKVFIHNPSANKRTPETNKKIPYTPPKKPTYIPPARNHRIQRMYRRAFEKGQLK